MKNECMGLINLDSIQNPSVNVLSDHRPVATIPIAGRYRLIDFTLSNMVNSGITNVGIYAREKYRSLTDHLGSGKDWDLSRKQGGLYVLSPENAKNNNNYGYRKGDIYTILANIDYIEKSPEEYVIVAPSYMICSIDYNDLLKYHKKSNNDITIVYKRVENANKDFKNCNTLNIDKDKLVKNVGNNLNTFPSANICMDTFIMKRTDFIECIYSIARMGTYSYIEDYIINQLDNIQVGAYKYEGYLKCITSLKSYYEASKEFLTEDVSREIFKSDRKIFTKDKSQAPTMYGENAEVKGSFIATGCQIDGTVEDSTLFRKVKIGKGSTIRDSVIMQSCKIGENVVLENVILDKNVVISDNKELKGDKDYPMVIEKNETV